MPAAGPSDAHRTIMELLSRRPVGATVCPSEVARTLAGQEPRSDAEGGWRALMPAVHAAVDRLLAEETIGLSWKGKRLAARSGPYRIAAMQS